jgi:Protein of unknown function (DUF2892)
MDHHRHYFGVGDSSPPAGGGSAIPPGGNVMSTNVGTADRIIRVIIGLALLDFAIGLIFPGTGWNWVGWIGIMPILTAVFRTCPLYSVLGMFT